MCTPDTSPECVNAKGSLTHPPFELTCLVQLYQIQPWGGNSTDILQECCETPAVEVYGSPPCWLYCNLTNNAAADSVDEWYFCHGGSVGFDGIQGNGNDGPLMFSSGLN